jgi:hypothetical protein
MHRIEQRKSALRQQDRPFTIRVQSRPEPFALDAGEDDLHIRSKAATIGRCPSPDGLKSLQSTLPLVSDAVYAAGAKVVRIAGGAHLSVALSLGAALPETKIGIVEVLDIGGELWSSVAGERQSTTDLHTEPVEINRSQRTGNRDRLAIFVSLTPDADRTAFQRLIREASDEFTAATIVTTTSHTRIDARDSGRLSADLAQVIKGFAANNGHAEVHLAFHGPYTMAVLIGRYLNTLRTVVYEWEGESPGGPSYNPVLVLEPGLAAGPITAVLT